MAKFDLESTIKKGVDAAINEPVFGGKSITEWAAIGMKAPQWIAVTDRLPEEGAYVLLLLDNKYYCIAHYIGDGKWITPGYGGCDARWWMPLPEPPEPPKEVSE